MGLQCWQITYNHFGFIFTFEIGISKFFEKIFENKPDFSFHYYFFKNITQQKLQKCQKWIIMILIMILPHPVIDPLQRLLNPPNLLNKCALNFQMRNLSTQLNLNNTHTWTKKHTLKLGKTAYPIYYSLMHLILVPFPVLKNVERVGTTR